MKTFRSIAVLPFERDLVARTVRDDLLMLVPHLSDIVAITNEQRKKSRDGSLHLLNRWETAIRLPGAIPEIGGRRIAWLDRAFWNASGNCSWRIEPTLYPERIACAGETVFETAIGGRGTRISFEGTIDLTLHGVVAPASDTALKGAVEFLATGVIPRNFQRLARAVREHLEHGAGRR